MRDGAPRDRDNAGLSGVALGPGTPLLRPHSAPQRLIEAVWRLRARKILRVLRSAFRQWHALATQGGPGAAGEKPGSFLASITDEAVRARPVARSAKDVRELIRQSSSQPRRDRSPSLTGPDWGGRSDGGDEGGTIRNSHARMLAR